MREIMSSKRYNRFNSKCVREKNITFNNPNDEARICLECTESECKGDCKRLRIELKKIREKKRK